MPESDLSGIAAWCAAEQQCSGIRTSQEPWDSFIDETWAKCRPAFRLSAAEAWKSGEKLWSLGRREL